MTDRPEKEIASSAVWLSEREREGEPRRRADAKGKPDSSSESQNGSGDATNCSHERNSPTKSTAPARRGTRSPIHSVSCGVSQKSSRGALSNSTNLWPGEKTGRERGGGGRSSNTKVMAAVGPSLGILKRRKGDPKRGKKHNAFCRSEQKGKT